MPKKSATKTASKERGVVVCTKDRGVFFGYVTGNVVSRDPLIVKRARMCVYWSVDMRGVVGLSTQGPSATCKISAAGPQIELRGITCVMECTAEAIQRWELGLWA